MAALKKYGAFPVALAALFFAVLLVFLAGTIRENKYTNETYGFSVVYPKTWKEVSGTGLGGEVLTLENADGKQISFAYANSLAEYSMQAPLDKRTSLKQALSYELTNIQEEQLGGEMAYVGDFENKGIAYIGKDIYVEHRGHIYSLSYETSLEGNTDVEKIVKSFRFLQ